MFGSRSCLTTVWVVEPFLYINMQGRFAKRPCIINRPYLSKPSSLHIETRNLNNRLFATSVGVIQGCFNDPLIARQ